MASDVRIYEVRNKETGDADFVKATNQPQAVRHVARSKFSVRVASSVSVADHMTGGGKILDATGPQQELPINNQE